MLGLSTHQERNIIDSNLVFRLKFMILNSFEMYGNVQWLNFMLELTNLLDAYSLPPWNSIRDECKDMIHFDHLSYLLIFCLVL